MFSKLFVSIVALAATAQASCVHGTSMMKRQEGAVQVSNFGYDGLQGPLNWAGLDPANSACRNSKVQSPIVIDSNVPFAAEAPQITIDSVAEAEFENLGTTLETIVNGTTVFAGATFELKQFHMHTPSEHRINSEYFPLEVHMVHEAADGTIAVIALPFQLSEDGTTTALLTSVIENLAQVKEPGTRTTTGALDFAEVINKIQTTPLFQYTGSLTTPPCAEGLTFLVLSEPLPIDVKSFNAIKSVIKFNARYTQNTLGQENLLDVSANLRIAEEGLVAASAGAAAGNGTQVDANGNVVKVTDNSPVDVIALVQSLVAQNKALKFETVTQTTTNVVLAEAGAAEGAAAGGAAADANKNNEGKTEETKTEETKTADPKAQAEVSSGHKGVFINGPIIHLPTIGKAEPETQVSSEDNVHRVKIERSRIGRRFASRSPSSKRRL